MHNESKLSRGAVRRSFISAIIVVIIGTILPAYNKKIKEEKGIKIERPAIKVSRWGTGAVKYQKY